MRGIGFFCILSWDDWSIGQVFLEQDKFHVLDSVEVTGDDASLLIAQAGIEYPGYAVPHIGVQT